MKYFYIYIEDNLVKLTYTDTPKEGYIQCDIDTAIMVKQLQNKQHAIYEAVRRIKSDKRRSKRMDKLYKEIYNDSLKELKKEFEAVVD